MKNYSYTLIIFICMFSLLFPQENDHLIQLSRGIGDTIDYFDRGMFGLYPDIGCYKYAQLFERDKKFLVTKITCLDDGKSRDTLLVNDYHELYLLRKQISSFMVENDKRFESPADVSVFTKSGNKYDGKLEMFSKNYLFLYSDLKDITDKTSPFRNRIPFSKVDSLTIQGLKPDVGSYIGYGALGGAGLGLGIGLYWINTENFREGYGIYIVGITTLVGAGVGALIGWLIGESLPPDFVNIRFNTPYDVIKLKEYSSYYSGFDYSLEEKYLELK